MPRGYKPEQVLTINPQTAWAKQNVRVCMPCEQAGAQTVATRLVAVANGGKRPKSVPMCTRHAQAAWKPDVGCVAEITLAGELARYPDPVQEEE
jgi:hypothetical protein